MKFTLNRALSAACLAAIPFAMLGCNSSNRSLATSEPVLYTASPNLLVQPTFGSQRVAFGCGDRLGGKIGEVQLARAESESMQFAATLVEPLD